MNSKQVHQGISASDTKDLYNIRQIPSIFLVTSCQNAKSLPK